MHLLVFDSDIAWAKAATDLWCARLRENPGLRMCLPSGNTPKRIFAEMRQAVGKGLASFAGADIFALDEYGGLPTQDPGKCANMIRQGLLAGIDLPPANFHWLDTEAPDLDAVCDAYEKAIDPGFDLTLLGLGLNGHLGLNEPGTPPDAPTRRVTMHPASTQASAHYVQNTSLPTWGATVGLKRLLESKEIWLLANGRSKADIIARVVKGEPDVSVPASWLKNHPNCWLMLDREAASSL